MSAITFPYGETVLVRRYTGEGDDGMGNLTDTWGEPIELTGCAIDPGGSLEPRNGSSERVTTEPTIYVPRGLVIGPRDLIIRHLETYEVEGHPADWTQPQTGWDPGILVLRVRRVEG